MHQDCCSTKCNHETFYSKVFLFLKLKENHAYTLICVLAVCPGSVSWQCVLAVCPGSVSWQCVLAVCPGSVSWQCVLAVCPGSVSWQCVLAVCPGNIIDLFSMMILKLYFP